MGNFLGIFAGSFAMGSACAVVTALISFVCVGKAGDCVFGMFQEMDNHQACKWLVWFKDDTALLGPSESPSRQRLVQVTEGPRLSSCPIPVLSLLI